MLSYSGNQLPDPQLLKKAHPAAWKLHAIQRDTGATETRPHGARSPALDECASKGPHLGVAPATQPTAGLGRHRLAKSTAAAPQMRAAPAAPTATPSSSPPRAPRSAWRKRTAKQCPGISGAAPRPARMRSVPPGSSHSCTADGKPLPGSACRRGMSQHVAPRQLLCNSSLHVRLIKGSSKNRRHGRLNS